MTDRLQPRHGGTRGPRLCTYSLLLILAMSPARAADVPPAEYFVQAACLDAADTPIPGRLPFEPGCDRTRPLAIGEPLPYRKHDWPGAGDALPRGYQASDSLLGTLRGRPAALQTFDFGNAPRDFGRRDPGDGGQAIPLQPGEIMVAMTEDASGPPQWFQSPACGPGWLVAIPPLTAAWQQRLVRLNITAGPAICATVFNPSLTRWRTAEIALPWREAATGATATTPASVLVSEHFSGTTIAAADHLERFWFARGLGLVRWERWEHDVRSRLPERVAMADLIARSRRCPPIALGDPPGPGWLPVDCRSWTNFARGTALPALDWPAAELR